MSSYRFDPGTSLPKVAEMTDCNIWTFNARVFLGIDVLPVRLGDRVRIRIANLTMTNHPIHLHGHHFAVGCTDGGWVPETWGPSAPSSSSATRRETGHSTATSRITR